uniref:Odorant binding protein n=1 Tax=Paracoccus marginatus TaxID=252483 RepID=A0AA51WAH6_9HEMI|nr:odorant binding protein [Paracoccus marginatus]
MNANVILLIFACAATATLSSAKYSSQLAERYAKECRKELKMDDADLESFADHKLPEKDIHNCFLDCIYSKFGVIENGKLNKDGYKMIAEMKSGNKNKEKSTTAERKFEKCSRQVMETIGQGCGIMKNLVECMTITKLELNHFQS